MKEEIYEQLVMEIKTDISFEAFEAFFMHLNKAKFDNMLFPKSSSLPRRVYNHPEYKHLYQIMRIYTFYESFLSVEHGVREMDFLYEDCEVFQEDTVFYIKLPISPIARVYSPLYATSGGRSIRTLRISNQLATTLNPEAYAIFEKSRLTPEQISTLDKLFFERK